MERLAVLRSLLCGFPSPPGNKHLKGPSGIEVETLAEENHHNNLESELG
jgi:hypothetical protein